MAKIKTNDQTSELIVTIEANKDVWKKTQESAFKKLAKDLSIKGFRKGSVPIDVAKKHIQNSDVLTKATKMQLDILVKDAAAEVEKDKIIILDSPTYKIEKISNTELEVSFIYPIYPKIKLASYKGTIKAKFNPDKVDKKLIDKEIEKLLGARVKMTSIKNPAKMGNVVNFDFEGFVNKKPFEGGKAEKYDLELGSNKFIPGFEEQMVGLKKGDKKDIEVTFPKTYHSEKLKGKKAIFKILVHDIKEKSIPSLDDKFASSLKIKGVKKVDDLKKYIEDIFYQHEIEKAKAEYQKIAFKELREKSTIPLPMQLVAREMQAQKNRFLEELKKQDLTLEKYLELTKLTEEKLSSQFKKAATKTLEDSFIFTEIAKKENVTLTDKDYEEGYEKLAKVYGQSGDAIKNMITKQQIQIPLTNDKVIDILIEKNKK